MKIKLTPLLFSLLGILTILLFFRLWIGAGSLPEIWELEEQIARQSSLNDQQEKRNAALQADVSELGRSDSAIEDHARSELGMIKKNETFYQVILREDEPQPLKVVPEEKSAVDAK
ncbi:MAG: FtsB family cell division protein [Thiolinea sp.]